jgi:two-component system response regulator HydG
MLERLLAPPHEVDLAADGRSGLERLERHAYDLILTDVRLPDLDGFAVLAQARQRSPDTEVILMTAYASVDAAVQAVKAGAYDYLAKPFEPDDLLLKVERALERRELRVRARAAEAALRQRDGQDEMLGESAAIRQVRALVERVADLDVTVLVTGESGTGKEVVARTVHRAGRRRDRPFVAVNCGAIPENLLESELFGHARGAFTGAAAAHEGLIEGAQDGTLFLDEIGDMPLDLQIKLNRAIEQRSYRRVGETKERPIQARVLAATHRDLAKLVAEGRFREDLYFRLNVYPIHLPPLRERGEDVFLLARLFLERAAIRFGCGVSGFTPEALRALAAHAWPGNVRELAHAVERAVIVAEGPDVRVEDLPDAVAAAARTVPAARAASSEAPYADLSYRDAMELAREHATRDYLDGLLRRHGGNVTRAAEQAGIERESLYRLLRRHGLDAGDYRP